MSSNPVPPPEPASDAASRPKSDEDRDILNDEEREKLLQEIEYLSQLIVQSQDSLLAHQVKIAQVLAQFGEARLRLEIARARLFKGRIERKAISARMHKAQAFLCEAFASLFPEGLPEELATVDEPKPKPKRPPRRNLKQRLKLAKKKKLGGSS